MTFLLPNPFLGKKHYDLFHQGGKTLVVISPKVKNFSKILPHLFLSTNSCIACRARSFNVRPV